MTPVDVRAEVRRDYHLTVRPWAAALAGFRLHATAGARVALRNSWMGVALTLFIVIVIAPSPLGVAWGVARSLTAAGESPGALYALAVLAVALSRAALPQVTAGSTGWFRSLPLGSLGQRRALVLALVFAQAPLLSGALASMIAVALTPTRQLSMTRLLAIPLIAVGAALLARPGRALQARWRDRGWLTQRIAWRAVSWRVVPCTLPAVIPVAGAWFFRANNVLTPAEATNVARLCGVVGVTLVISGLADELHRRRAVWPWARSLPWSSTQRIGHDMMSLMVGVVPVLMALAVLDLVAVAGVLAVTPLLALVAAGAIRRAGTRRTAAAGEVLLFGVIVTTVLALSRWSLVAVVAATPLALFVAARRERQLSPSQWRELHHCVDGDSAFPGAA